MEPMGRRPRFRSNFTVPRGSYPTPFLGYLVLWLGSVILKSRRPKKGVGYEPPGMTIWGREGAPASLEGLY